MSNFPNIFASFGSFEFLALLTLAAAKATLLLAVAALLCSVFRRFSAATRHLLWACALCASLLIPFLSFAAFEVPVLPTSFAELKASPANESTTAGKDAEVRQAPKRADSKSLFELEGDSQNKTEFQTNADEFKLSDAGGSAATPAGAAPMLAPFVFWALIIWLAGALLLSLRLSIGLTATNMLARRGVEFENPELNNLFSALAARLNLKTAVRLRRSESASMPIVCGVWRPVVLLPVEAEAWSTERLKMVLLHELTHVARRDCLTQMMAQLACALYWFNPFVWFAERRLRVEREQACDDFVLSAGARPSDYAQHLLEIARSLNNRSIFDWSRPTTVAIARKSQLEGRLLAILSRDAERRAMSRLANASIISLICFLFLSLALVRPTPINAHKPQNTKEIANSPGEEKTLLESFRSFGLRDETGGAGHETAAKQSTEINEKSIPSILNGLPANEVSERDTIRDLESAAESNTAREISPENPNPTPTVADSESIPAPIPLIDASYEREPNGGVRQQPEDYIDEMASVGYTNLSVNDLVRLKQAGVTAEYVRNLRALGFSDLVVRELASMGLHGVTPAYIQSIRNAGYNDLSPRELTNFRIHDVTPEFIKSLRVAGYDNLPPRVLVDFAAHEVTPAYIAALRAIGFGNLAPREIVSLRIYDVTPDFIRKARSRFGELTLKQIISLKNGDALDEDKDKDKEEN